MNYYQIINTSFINNKAINAPGNLIISNKFTNLVNESEYMKKSALIDCIFYNSTGFNGGSILLMENSILVLDRCQFIN